ncbi:MAG: hypothetical protein R2823_01550 [Acidimicrobiia bacterium]
MKVRLADGEMRVRLSTVEIAGLLEGGEATVAVGDTVLVAVRTTDDAEARLTADLGRISIDLPRSKMQSPGPDGPLIHQFSEQGAAVVVELDLGRRPR